MEISVVAGWSDFTAASTAGALAGLLFVAVSINLSRIIEAPGVSGRAAEAIILLSATLSEALASLVPHLSAAALGLAFAIVSVPAWLAPVVIQIQSIRARTYLKPPYAVVRGVLHQLQCSPRWRYGGCYRGGILWLAAGAIFSMLVAILNAWVLLVEILR
jgi:hypothetical protein